MSRRQIERVVPLRRDPGLCCVHVGDRRFEPLRRDDAERLGVREGAPWNVALERKVEALIAVAAARQAALATLARAARSRAWLLERLVARGHDSAAVNEALAQLDRDGWLDDRRSAETRAVSLKTRGAMARSHLEASLEAEGYGKHARPVAAAALEGASDLDRAIVEARKQRRLGRSARAIAGVLARRGFDCDTIGTALERAGLRPMESADESSHDA